MVPFDETEPFLPSGGTQPPSPLLPPTQPPSEVDPSEAPPPQSAALRVRKQTAGGHSVGFGAVWTEADVAFDNAVRRGMQLREERIARGEEVGKCPPMRVGF